MKELINLVQNQGVNYPVIWADASIFVAVLLLIAIACLLVIIVEEKDLKDSLSIDLVFAQKKLENKDGENLALSLTNDLLKFENDDLKRRIEKYNFPRNEKGKFVSKNVQLKTVENL